MSKKSHLAPIQANLFPLYVLIGFSILLSLVVLIYLFFFSRTFIAPNPVLSGVSTVSQVNQEQEVGLVTTEPVVVTTVSSEDKPATVGVARYLTISEWGVKYLIPTDLAEVAYQFRDDNTVLLAARLSSDSEVIGNTCYSNFDTNLATILRAKTLFELDPRCATPAAPETNLCTGDGMYFQKVADYWYGYGVSQDVSCKDDFEISREKRTRELLIEMLRYPERT